MRSAGLIQRPAQSGSIHANYAGYIGKLDPKSGSVTEFKINDPRGGDSHTPVIAPDGIVWYSESRVTPNTLVRFDPKAESFQKWNIPSGGGVVRNMVATSDGRLYLACSGVNKVAVATIRQ
jgi:virginiamycin B lyase